jgi:leucyl/phenylalanyl-tRNA---protein transferase
LIPPSLLVEGYRRGLFPMGMPDGSVQWFSPDPRGILPLEKSHFPSRLDRSARRAGFTIRVNTAFGDVISACAERPDGDGTWITQEIRDSYESLHDMGFAHSVETWRDGQLVGGLYGVAVGCAFFGESMFHRETDASKFALKGLVSRMISNGFRLLDIQWVTPHLKQFGAIEIPRQEYLRLLSRCVDGVCTFPKV